MGERHLGFTVVGAPREEGAEPLFGIVPLVASHENFGDIEVQYVVSCRIGIVGEGGFEGALGDGKGVVAERGEGFGNLATIGRGVSRRGVRFCCIGFRYGRRQRARTE